jgi:hypothetical protein
MKLKVALFRDHWQSRYRRLRSIEYFLLQFPVSTRLLNMIRDLRLGLFLVTLAVYYAAGDTSKSTNRSLLLYYAINERETKKTHHAPGESYLPE